MNTGPSKNGRVKLIQLHMYQGSPLFRTFPPSFLCCPRPRSHHLSSLTSVSLIPALHLLPTSTPFQTYGTHPFFPHAQTISILSVMLYSLTPFLFQLSNAPLHPFVTLQPNFPNTSSQEHLLSFSQHFSYRTTPLVQLLLHIDTSWPLSPILYGSEHFSALSKAIPLIHSVYHIHFISSISCHLQSLVLKQYTSSNVSPFNITCIRPPAPNLEHLITLLLPTLTRNFLLSDTSNSLYKYNITTICINTILVNIIWHFL